MHQLAEEKRAVLKTLLGVEPEESLLVQPAQDAFGALSSFLPPDKRSSLVQIEQRYASRLQQLHRESDGHDLEQVRALEQDKETELLQLERLP